MANVQKYKDGDELAYTAEASNREERSGFYQRLPGL
jgi:hypothetical protein